MISLAKIPPSVLIKVLTSTQPVTYSDVRAVLQKMYPDLLGTNSTPATPEHPAEVSGPPCHLENVFHDWYRDEGEDSDMSTPEEVSDIVSGKRRMPPPPATLWVQCDAPKKENWLFDGGHSIYTYHFQFNNEPVYTILGPELVEGKSAYFKVNGWRRYNEQLGTHLLVRVLPPASGGTIKFWCSEWNGTEYVPGSPVSFESASPKEQSE